MLWRNHRGEEKRLTFSDLKTLSNQAANLLRSHGLQKGDVVMTALRTHWSYWIVALAAHKLGLLLAPVYYRLTAEDFRYRMEKAKVRCVVTCREGPAAENIWAAAEQAHHRQAAQGPAHIVLPPLDLRHGDGGIHGERDDERIQHGRSPFFTMDLAGDGCIR